MKKKVAFQKEIEFPTMIGEVSAISLEHNLKFVDESSVEGELLLSGKYKLTEASRLEEDFSYKIPTEIALTEKLDLNTAKIEITDFYYEIANEDTMVCNIELLIDGVEVVELEDTSEDNEDADKMDRECDGDSKETKEIELPKIEKEESAQIIEEKEAETEVLENKREEMKEEVGKMGIVKKEEKIEVDKEVKSLFANIADDQETYGTFLVYIVRQNESINSIIEKYNTSVEEIEKYNDLNDLSIGTKLIIPIIDA